MATLQLRDEIRRCWKGYCSGGASVSKTNRKPFRKPWLYFRKVKIVFEFERIRIEETKRKRLRFPTPNIFRRMRSIEIEVIFEEYGVVYECVLRP